MHHECFATVEYKSGHSCHIDSFTGIKMKLTLWMNILYVMWIYRRALAKYVSSDTQQKISSVKYFLHDTGRVWVNHVRTGRVQFLAGAEISHCCTLSKPCMGWTKPIQWVTECKINMAANCLQHKYRGHQEQCSFKQWGTIFVIQVPDTALMNSFNFKECWFVYFFYWIGFCKDFRFSCQWRLIVWCCTCCIV